MELKQGKNSRTGDNINIRCITEICFSFVLSFLYFFRLGIFYSLHIFHYAFKVWFKSALRSAVWCDLCLNRVIPTYKKTIWQFCMTGCEYEFNHYYLELHIETEIMCMCSVWPPAAYHRIYFYVYICVLDNGTSYQHVHNNSILQLGRKLFSFKAKSYQAPMCLSTSAYLVLIYSKAFISKLDFKIKSLVVRGLLCRCSQRFQHIA